MNSILYRLAFFIAVFLLQSSRASSNDSIAAGKERKNSIYLEFYGNNYLSPFSFNSNSKISINYSFRSNQKKYFLEFCVGFSLYHSDWADDPWYRNYNYHDRYQLSTPAGLVAGKNNKRNCLVFGLFCTSAFGKQQQFPNEGFYSVTVHYDFQITTDFGYQYRTKNERFICRIAWTPKYKPFAVVESPTERWKYYFSPLWFGLSIGGAW